MDGVDDTNKNGVRVYQKHQVPRHHPGHGILIKHHLDVTLGIGCDGLLPGSMATLKVHGVHELWRQYPNVAGADDFWYDPPTGEWFVKEWF